VPTDTNGMIDVYVHDAVERDAREHRSSERERRGLLPRLDLRRQSHRVLRPTGDLVPGDKTCTATCSSTTARSARP
jgi:hypothetical protein